VPHNLLLADDSVTIQRVIELTFADEDVQVFAVSDGEQAIARIEASPPDIVLADIAMPGKSGYEVAQHIKHSPRLAHIPVILLTGAFEPVDEARAAAAGCEGVLAKPFEPQLVIGRVRELLAGGSRPVELPLSSAAATPPQHAEPPEPAAHTRHAFWPPIADETPAPSTSSAVPPDLDSYFDRLDEAFATLGAPAQTAVSPASPDDSVGPAGEVDWFGNVHTQAPSTAETAAEPANSTTPAHDTEPADTSISYASPLAEFDRLGGLLPAAPEPAADAQAADQSEPTAVAPPANSPLEPVVSAHTEPPPSPEPRTEIPQAPVGAVPALPRSEPVVSSAAPGLPTLADAFAALLAAEQHDTSDVASAWPSSPAAAEVSDQHMDEIVQRVLGRMSDRVVREIVSGLVSTIAERMIREEIDRIKGAVR
jgi:CheY-like chemotaxis protein